MEKKILVVDDDDTIRTMLEEFFTDFGYIVRTAESAERAIEVLKEESIMVMYIDLKLPGMSGKELCQKIRMQNPLAIISAITGYTDLFGLLECRTAGFDDFFKKPVTIKVLMESAQEAFKKLERWRIDEYDLI